jgi:hypothetical protein
MINNKWQIRRLVMHLFLVENQTYFVTIAKLVDSLLVIVRRQVHAVDNDEPT